MSAYIVSKKHITMMVETAMDGTKECAGPNWKLFALRLPPGVYDANSLGQCLIEENLKSIHARYPDTVTDPTNTPGPIKQYWHKPYKHPNVVLEKLTAVVALKAIACYEYQSCEHDEWNTSEVKEFCDRLRHKLINALPGYDAAPWGID